MVLCRKSRLRRRAVSVLVVWGMGMAQGRLFAAGTPTSSAALAVPFPSDGMLRLPAEPVQPLACSPAEFSGFWRSGV